MTKKVGVIGAGSFGTAVSNLLSRNTEVLLYARRQEIIDKINIERQHKGVKIHKNITAVDSLEEIARECDLIFPIVPSKNFRAMMQDFSPYLKPYHILIHGTKGLTVDDGNIVSAKYIYTMSDVIRQECSVVRIGCLSGPNISKEILQGQTTATVIASEFQEVIDLGKQALKSRYLQVYSTRDIRATELAGALKNIIAISSGILSGLKLGKNLWGLLITRGLTEMIHFGKAIGADVKPFLGVAGIGDLVTTASSTNSRNFTVGNYLAQGKSLEEIRELMDEVAEGVHTVLFAKKLADEYNLEVPITRMVYKVIYENFKIRNALEYLVKMDYEHDVDYI